GGAYSFAAGRRAKVTHDGSFVWGDSFNGDVSSSAINQFTARTSGGARFYSNTGLTTGVTLAAGGGAWAAISDSTVKENIRPVDGDDILDKISQLDITRWNYETQDESIEHIGPMAQDFHRLFGVGDNNTTITTIDPDGISLAAIKALIEKNNELQTSNEELNKRLDKLERLIEELSNN
ncbi:MAG: tail fiber domain-containing protein, partial [candidate division Zixibacteria bacterium]